jgi:hypothetical protein
VAPNGPSAVLVDTATGKTWELVRGGAGRSAWIPVRKFDSDQEARKWLGAEKKRAVGRERAKDSILRPEAGHEAPRRRDQLREHDEAVQALEQARQRLRELEQRTAPDDKDKN